MNCEHNFVTLEGDAWLCHDCELYFPKHPADMEAAAKANYEISKEFIDEFTNGITTLGEAAQEARVTMEQFAEAVKKSFAIPVPIYDDMYELGKQGPVAKVFMGLEPQRTSCPLEVDQFYGSNPSIDGIGSRFSDVTCISHSREMESGFDAVQSTFMIEFVDGSEQKVIG